MSTPADLLRACWQLLSGMQAVHQLCQDVSHSRAIA